jgi:AcrR family transcriptional regulator
MTQSLPIAASPSPETPRQRRSQAERRAESDRRILLAASELIAEQGYGATTLAQIGDRAGYSRGLVTQKFGSKEGLVRALVAILHKQYDAIAIGHGVERHEGIAAVLAAVDVYIRVFALEPRPLRAYYVLMSESIGVIPEIRNTFIDSNRRATAYMAKLLDRAKSTGSVRAGVDTLALAAVINSMLTGLTLIWLVDPDGMDLDKIRAAAIDSVTRTLADA